MERRKRSCRMRKPISACSTSPRKPMHLRASGKASKTQRRVVCVRRAKPWRCSAATMPYLVRLADRALRDMQAIYEFIEADASERAFSTHPRETHLDRHPGVACARLLRGLSLSSPPHASPEANRSARVLKDSA